MEQNFLEEEYNWFWLCSIPGMYEPDRKNLLRMFGSPAEVRSAAEHKPNAFAFLNKKKQQSLIRHQKSFFVQEEYHKCERSGIKFISCRHTDYPASLLKISDYPSGLFYKGGLPKETCVAVIGSRMCTYHGRNTAQELAERLAQNHVSVVSGMAYGIDAKAQEACIAANGRSYAVLGCGVDICYPSENKRLYESLLENGGIISEYYPGTSPLPYHFPIRNRIISGLSQIVVVVEAKKKSGTLITADLALEQGKDVYAFPGRPQDVLSAGCNRLIQQGAGMILDIDEFLQENGLLHQKTEKRQSYKLGLAMSENLVYSCLDSEPKSLQMLNDETDLPIWQLMGILSSLQLKGLIAEIGKNFYEKIR